MQRLKSLAKMGDNSSKRFFNTVTGISSRPVAFDTDNEETILILLAPQLFASEIEQLLSERETQVMGD